MNKKPIITTFQLAVMVVGSALVFPYTFMPILNSPPANQDVWIVLILSFVYIVILNAPLIFLINKFKGIEFNEWSSLTLGKLFGNTALIIYVLFFLYCYVACSLITTQFSSIYLFPGTPMWALLSFMLIPVCYCARKGAGTIGRLAIFIVPFIIFTIIVFLLFGINKMDFSVLSPVLADSSFDGLNLGAFLTASRFSDILVFVVFSYYLGEKASIKKTYTAALVVFGICFLLILLPTILVLGIDFARIAWNPYYVFSRQVEGFTFLERIQSLNTLAWYPTSLLKLIIYNYMASKVFSRIVNAKSYKSFVIPFAVVGYIVCLLPFMNDTATIKLLSSDQVLPWVVLPVTLIIPVITLVVYLIRKKKLAPFIEKAKQESSASTKE